MILEAGYAKTEIVPPGILHLSGIATKKPRIGSETRDSLMARAVALKQGENKIVIVAADLLCIPEELHLAVVEAVSILEIQSVFLCATHTHSSFGGVFQAGELEEILGTPQREFFDFLVSRLSQLTKDALLDLERTKPFTSIVEIPGMVSNRRQKEGPYDDEVTMLRLVREKRRPIDIVCASGHPVIVALKAPETVSGDYPGEVCRRLENEGSDPVFLCAGLGGASILFPEYEMSLSRQMNLIAGMLVDGCKAAIKELVPVDDAILKNDFFYLPVGRHKCNIFAGLGWRGRILDGLAAYSRSKFRKAFRRCVPLENGIPLHMLRLGDFLLLGVPADTGIGVVLKVRKIANECGFRVGAVASQVNAYAGYTHLSSDYERWPEKGYRFMAFYENGLAVFGYKLGDKIVEAVEKLIRE